MNNNAKIPRWLQRAVAQPAPEGGRHRQMIRLAPALIKSGYSADELHSLFDEMYGGDIGGREIAGVVRSAFKYAQREIQPHSIDAEQRAQLAQLTCQAGRDLPMILQKYFWPWSEITQDIANEAGANQTKKFLNTLFDPDDVIWIGMKWDSGQERHRCHFRAVKDWLERHAYFGEFCSHSAFQPGTYSRTNEAVSARKYLVVESDVLSKDEVGAIFRWLEHSGLVLRAIVDSGKHSLHGWFVYPGDQFLPNWLAMLAGLKCDPATATPSQPVRLPGVIRFNTKKLQSLLYIK